MSSGSSRETSAYIASRHVQKSSVGWPRNSARPAMARWNACECTLGMPGITGPWARGSECETDAGTTRVKTPSAFHSRCTSRAQPEGSSASAAKSSGIDGFLFAYDTAMGATLLVNARIATMRGGRYSVVENGAIRVRDGRIAWVGPTEQTDGEGAFDAQGALVTPGLVDCHTHLVYAGDRSGEFER